MSHRIRKPPAVFLAAAFVLAAAGPAFTENLIAGQAEAEVKAVFLFNFIRYLAWPDDNGLAYCPIVVLGDSPVFTPLQDIARKQAAGTIPIQVRRCSSLQDAGLPRILFISESAASLLHEALDKFRGTDTLIVGETEGLAVRGAAINFVLREDTVKFEINVNALKAARIQAGSQLLRLAILVDGEQKDPR
jgi:hypothetical protein